MDFPFPRQYLLLSVSNLGLHEFFPYPLWDVWYIDHVQVLFIQSQPWLHSPREQKPCPVQQMLFHHEYSLLLSVPNSLSLLFPQWSLGLRRRECRIAVPLGVEHPIYSQHIEQLSVFVLITHYCYCKRKFLWRGLIGEIKVRTSRVGYYSALSQM